MNFSDENLPHSIRVQSRSSSSSSISASKPSSRVPSTRVIVTNPVEERDDQFETLLSLIATDRSPSREDQEGKGLESVGGGGGVEGRGADVARSSPLGAGKRANGRFMEGLGVGRPSEPASLLSPNRPSISKPSRLSSYSSVPTPPSTTLRPPGTSPPPARPHSVSGERLTATESIFSTTSPSLFPLPPRPSTIHEVPSTGTPLVPSQVSALRPQSQTSTHSRNASASSSNSAASATYRMVGPPVVMKAELTMEEDPFGARSSPVKEAFVGEGGAEDDEDSLSSDEDSSGSDAEHVERLIPPSSAPNHVPFTQSQPYHQTDHQQPTPPHSTGSPTQVYHHPTPGQLQPQPEPQPSLPPNYPQQQHPQPTHLHRRHPQNIFQPPHLPPSAASDYNSFEQPVPPAYPPANAERTTSLTMQIAQSEGWAVDPNESEEQTEGVSASSEGGGGGDGSYDDQREFLTRPLGLLALSQALSAANDEVDALRSVVKDITSLVHAQAQDAFVQAQLRHQQQKQQRQGRVGGDGHDDAGVGGSGLSDREIDELSGSEARELLKSLTTPPPSQITSSLALIKHLHQLASEGEVSTAEGEEEIFSDANLMRLAEVVEGWKRG